MINKQLAKMMRIYSKYTGVDVRRLQKTWIMSTPKEQEEYRAEMKQLIELQQEGKLPKVKPSIIKRQI